MRFLHPLLLLSAAPAAVAIAWLLRARGAGGRRWAAVLRCASLALIVLALGQPQIGHGAGGPVVLALDRSLSIGPGESAVERSWLTATAGCGTSCGIVQFAGVPRVTARPAGLLPAQALEGGRTNLRSALGLALGRAPTGGRVVLLSDGLQTTGEAGALAAGARARGVRIDVVPLRDGRRDAAVTRVQAPRALHAGDPFSLELTIASTAAAEATLSLEVDGAPAGKRRVPLATGETPYALRETAPARPGSYDYEVSVSLPGDSIPQNDALGASVRVESEPRVLVAGAGAPTIAATLGADGIGTQVLAPGALPTTASGYGPQDAVVLSDVSAGELGDARAEALDGAVRAGTVGVLALGGPHSFSLGRYYDSPLQRLMPVSSLVPGNVRGAVALELVLDHSGSMIDLAGEYPKIEMAQTASSVAAKFLSEHQDYLGLVAFNAQPKIVVPLQRVAKGAALRRIQSQIDGLQAEGGTDIYKGLAAGVREIEGSKVPDRHIVLMTDGVSEEPGSYVKLLPQLRREHITISTIALGEEADTGLLQAIARKTGGTYHKVNEAGELPKIFAKETRLSARPVRLHGTIPVSAGEPSPILESLEGQSVPPLHGNVVTVVKPGAQGDLWGRGAKAPEADPVLAQWQYGVGRVAAWTPGIAPAWAAQWAERTALWQDAVRWVERGAGIPALTPAVDPGDPEELVVDTVANAGVSLDLLELAGSLSAPGGRRVPLSFTQTAPGTYLAPLPRGLEEGGYGYTITGGPQSASGVLAVPYPPEYRPAGPPSRTALGTLAADTGGEVLPVNGEAALQSSWTAIWRWLAALALLCFLADIVLRMLGRRPPGPGAPLRRRPARPAAPPRRADRAVARS